MFTRIIRIFAIFIAAVLLACVIYFGKLYGETTDAFIQLKPEIAQVHDVTEAGVFIGKILFDDANKEQATPAYLIARQQLNHRPQDTMFRYQMKKLVLAFRISKGFSDEKILSYWLSSVYFGNGEYGLDIAAQSLFQKNSDALSQEELISLAALIRRPQLRRDPESWRQMQNRLKDELRQRSEGLNLKSADEEKL